MFMTVVKEYFFLVLRAFSCRHLWKWGASIGINPDMPESEASGYFFAFPKGSQRAVKVPFMAHDRMALLSPDKDVIADLFSQCMTFGYTPITVQIKDGDYIDTYYARDYAPDMAAAI